MISIVIPLYNKEKSIARTLESVLVQTYTDWECIIVNDGSTDESAQVVRNVICKMGNGICKKFRLIDQANAGVSAARNAGVRESKGMYVAFLDADDLWDKDYLKEQVRLINDFPVASIWAINFAEMYHGRLVRTLATGLPMDYRGYVDNYFELANQGRKSDLCHASAVVIRKAVFDNVGHFDSRIKIAEDDDMWWRIIAEYRLAFYDRYMVFYQLDTENRALGKPWKIKNHLSYYPEKFAVYKQKNPIFYRYIQHWCGMNIQRHYFEYPEDKNDAAIAAKKLDYSVLPKKYWWQFKMPYHFGKMVYQLSLIKRKYLK